ncbi:MAG: amidohydrolase family protein [Rhodospirillales bacterium]|jgi:2,3-dihydroxybenzoate decarboxylase
MASKTGSQIIAIEEHYLDPEVSQHFQGRDDSRAPAIVERLLDLAEGRLNDMDEAGIDIQVLSHGAPATQRIPADIAVPLSIEANDRLYETVQAKPDRFAGFAVLPTDDPKASADELERTVDKLGFKGAMIHGPSNGVFLDDKKFWPIYERAEALDVPIYIHPSIPMESVIQAYYADYLDDYPTLASNAWGFTVETATHGIRMVLSGVFEKHPGLKIILGHLGESLPFSLWRIDAGLKRSRQNMTSFRDLFCEHFYITTSGNFSDPAMRCCIEEMGVDRVIFSIDWPFVQNAPGVEWMERIELSQEDKDKILHGNAKRLLRM